MKVMKTKKNLSKKKTWDYVFYAGLILLPIGHFFVFYLGVNINSFIMLFQRYDVNTYQYVFNGLNNFEQFFKQLKETLIINAFKNALIGWLFITVLKVPLGVFFSNYIYKKAYGSTFFKIVLFFPSIVPSVVLTMLFRHVTDGIVPEIIRYVNPNAQYLGFVGVPTKAFTAMMTYSMITGFGTNVLLYVGAMTAIPDSVVEAANLDGCTGMREFWYITLPYIWPTFTTFFVMQLGGIFSAQYELYTFYGAKAFDESYTVGYYLFRSAQWATSVQYPAIATFGVCLTVIIAPLTLFVRWAMNKFGYSVS